ncbi:MAG: HNH endonuclease [Lachnospiraceae bacterium]|nr:HNH endonuclease [Lachnospiraceae bacterium]
MARDFARSFYASKEWEKVRTFVMMRDRYMCQKCGRPAQEVHHKIHLSPENIWDVSITLNPDNLVALCRDCHFAQHEEDKAKGNKKRSPASGEGYHFDSNGQLIPDLITPPVAAKS